MNNVLHPLPDSAPAWGLGMEARLLAGQETELDLLWSEPQRIMSGMGLIPDPWQERLLLSPSDRLLLMCCRQAGKSTATAALAIMTAILEAPALILLLSPTQRQSGELFRDKVLRLYRHLRDLAPPLRETALTLELQNGSRIISLPENEEGIRGYSGVTLLVIDEASRVSDAIYRAVRPMLAVSNGRLIALSTPFGKRGWFFDSWESSEPWERIRITAPQCPRISPQFLAEERRVLGERYFSQEYLCTFEDTIDAVFSFSDIHRAVSDDVVPLFP